MQQRCIVNALCRRVRNDTECQMDSEGTYLQFDIRDSHVSTIGHKEKIKVDFVPSIYIYFA